MKDIRSRLRDADPVSREPSLSPDTVAGLRRAVLAAAHAAPARPIQWGRQLAVAGSLVVITLAGLVVAHRVPSGRAAREVAGSTVPAASGQPTQVHFSTPGGTRIVWTLDPGFELRETRR